MNINGIIYIIIGMIIAIASKYVGDSLIFFFYLGLLFIVIGSIKLIITYLSKSPQSKNARYHANSHNAGQNHQNYHYSAHHNPYQSEPQYPAQNDHLAHHQQSHQSHSQHHSNSNPSNNPVHRSAPIHHSNPIRIRQSADSNVHNISTATYPHHNPPVLNQQPVHQPYNKFCSRCHSQVSSSSHFCARCGSTFFYRKT